MTALQVRRQLEPIVKDLVGSYTLPNTQVVPAIYVLEGSRETDPDLGVEGTEIIIEEIVPTVRSANLYNSTPVSRQYTVRLVQWSGSELNRIAETIVGCFNGATIAPIAVPEEIGPTKQAIITIPSSYFHRAMQSFDAA